MVLQLDGRIKAGNDLLDGDLRDIEIVSSAAGTFLYAATGQNGGVSVYRIDTAGGLASLSDTGYFSSSGIAMGSFKVLDLDGAMRLFLAGTGNGQLTGFGIEGNGDISATLYSDLPGTGVETAAALSAVSLSGGITALYMVDGDTGALRAYTSDGTGALTGTAGQSGKASAYDLDAVVALETAQAGGVSYLLAADAASGGVRSYRIDDTSGALQYTDSLGAENGLGIAAPSAMQVVAAHGATWVILAAAGSGSLSVMQLSATGQLSPADHILDTLATRFGGVAALEVIKVGGHVFVLAGGGDDGLSLFTLLPGGQLVHMQSLAHSTGAGLENVTGISAVQVGDELQIFVTSGGDLGISQLSLPLDDLGSVIQSGGGQVLGTGAGDLILGAGAQDQLMGQGGDDILVAAHAGGTLSGGAGADIFVLCPTTGNLEISDFEPGLDRLDLTRFPMLRSISQLDLKSTTTGIEIRYGTTLIVVHSFDGTTLKAGDLWPAGFDTPDRVPIPPGPVIRVTRGTLADDSLILGLGQDRIWGLAGDDLIRGGVGADRMIGGAGADRIFGGKGGDTLKGGKGGDMLAGGVGNDHLRGAGNDDILRGEDGKDRLIGGTGADRLLGGKGADTLNGGKGGDTLKGGAGADTLSGDKGDDTLRGGARGDTLTGATGRDKLFGGGGDDILQGGAGQDRLFGGAGHDTLKGGTDRDELFGGAGRDILQGGGARDLLNGGDKGDTLSGGGGNDRLVGGRGDDILTGGAGRDVFIFGAGDGKGHGDDRISDFITGKDHIRIAIAGVGFDDLTLTRQANGTGIGTGFDTLIDTGYGTITLIDMRPKHLSADDFLFS